MDKSPNPRTRHSLREVAIRIEVASPRGAAIPEVLVTDWEECRCLLRGRRSSLVSSCTESPEVPIRIGGDAVTGLANWLGTVGHWDDA